MNVCLVFLYRKHNRYSINALLGALELHPLWSKIPILLARTEDDLFCLLQQIVNLYERVILGVPFFTTQLKETGGLIARVKTQYNHRVVAIAGGPHPTGAPQETLRMGFDIVVRGEAEETLPDLLDAVVQKRELKEIKGIAFIEDRGEYRYTGRRGPVDINRYHPFSLRFNALGPVEITRGCPYLCRFCQTPYLFGTRPRHRDIDIICRYVNALRKRGKRDIRFITPNAFGYGSVDGRSLNPVSVEELLKEVRRTVGPEGRIFFGSFPSEVRPEHVTEETIHLLLRYADNTNLVIGAQTGSQRLLDHCHRGHTVEDVYRAVEITRRAGLTPNVDFIFGLPGETEEDIRQTILVITDLIKMGARIHAHTFMPLPQTPFGKSKGGRVHPSLKDLINRYLSRGVIYGNWLKQEEMARVLNKTI